MKPPARQRQVPERYRKLAEPDQRIRHYERWFGWKRSERRVILRELERQRSRTDLDLTAIQAKIPKRSIQEIENFVLLLKNMVGRKVTRHLQRKRQEEVPIELWTDMALKMAGSLEGAISSAFSQMLVIAATEPCSLLNSDPPRPLQMPQLLPANLRTVPPRPLPRPVAETPSPDTPSKGKTAPRCRSRRTSKVPGPSPGPEGQLQEAKDSPAAPPPRDPPKEASTSASAPAPSSPSPDCTPANLSQPNHNEGSTPSSSSQPAQQPASPDTREPAQGAEQSSSSTDQQTYTRPVKQKDLVVNFENIYHFLNAVNKQGKRPTLTAMESAVILDLLLSLPEELPLLDCKELQHHMWQVYSRLTAPVENLCPDSNGSQQSHTPPGQVSRDAASGTRPQRGGISTTQNGGQNSLPVAAATSHSTEQAASDSPTEGGASCSSEKTSTNQEIKAEVHITGCSPGGQKDRPESTNRSEATTAASGQPGAGPQPISTERPGAQNQRAGSPFPTASPSTSHTAQQNASRSHSATSPARGTATQTADWSKAGVCPLNPFMVPVKLLARTNPQRDPESLQTVSHETEVTPALVTQGMLGV